MTMKNKHVGCPLCRSSKGERIIQIAQEQERLAKRLNEARNTREISIKEMSALLDRLDELKEERVNMSLAAL